MEWQYNWQHVVFVSNKRKRVFKKERNREVVRHGIEKAVLRFEIGIKEFSFGDDYKHVHMELNVPNTLSILQVIQILKSHSASLVFREIPNFHKLYSRGSFWGGQYINSSVGPMNEEAIKNYIRRQDVSNDNIVRQRRLFN